MSKDIKPYKAAIPDAQLQDLGRRLEYTRWPEPETVEGWDQGMPLEYARELAAYWASDYDWRRFETRLNGWPQFTTRIDDIDIHFIHVRSPREDALPLIISHGWPGSIVEFHKVIDALTDPADHGGDAKDAFHVIAPCLPGYGFSGKPQQAGTSVQKIAGMWSELMARLGYERYVAQGGDWGSMITMNIGLADAEHCAGIHLNMPVVIPDPDTMDDLTEREQAALADMGAYGDKGSGYSKQQSTYPQTLGYALADSPVGQMAWIVEKFYNWTDCERNGTRHPENVLSKDELLDNVMFYWLNNAGASSGRLYWESFDNPGMEPIDVPTGCSIFPKEIFRCSERWAKQRFKNLVYWNELERGGHFAAFEQPDVFVEELRNCFRQLR
ncbi:MAG: epoxide hydrolase [Halioglobus sp.]|nr:epoxide hydrolase [Halioglobus sp.]